MRKGSIKNTRINSEIQKELLSMIHSELNDPRIHMMASVASVDTATDLKTCKVYISVMGATDEEKDNTITGLNSAKGYIRKELARRINLRHTPELIFIKDELMEYGNHLMDLINSVSASNINDEKEEEE